MTIEWSEELETGIGLIDSQHKELIKRANDLMEATRNRKGKEEIEGLLDFLGNYVMEHFEAEENAMQVHEYPNYMAHRSHHTTFVMNLEDLKKTFAAEGPTSNVLILAQRRLVDWVINHIKKVDKMFARYLKEQGIELKEQD